MLVYIITGYTNLFSDAFIIHISNRISKIFVEFLKTVFKIIQFFCNI